MEEWSADLPRCGEPKLLRLNILAASQVYTVVVFFYCSSPGTNMRPQTARGYTCLFCASDLGQSARPKKAISSQWRANSTSTAARPSTAPKPVLDIKHIARNPGLYSQNCLLRNYPSFSQHPFDILTLTQRRAELVKQSLDLRTKSKESSKKIEKLRLTERDSEKKGMLDNKIMAALLASAQSAKKELSAYTTELEDIEAELDRLAAGLPNLSSVWTPEGDEAKTLSTYIPPGSKLEAGESHVDIGVALKMLDFSSAAQTSGWGWYFLTGPGALLEQALIQFALSKLHARGWTVVVPPSMVYAHIAAACGFQPRDQHGEHQIYTLQQPERDEGTKPQHVLAATAEIPLAGMHAGKTFEPAELPLKTVAVSRCYRAEAGARGVDTKGLYRVHEFTKVEMFAWTPPDAAADAPGAGANFDTTPSAAAAGHSASTAVFDEMVALQRELLTALGLPHRVLEMPTADLGASAARKVDIEAWFPGRTRASGAGWGEVTSASVCTDFQSRRLGTRVRRRDGEGLAWCHTVNGTAMAVPRVLAALLENGWDAAERRFTVPEVLRPWMYGVDVVKV
ncbi:hypothetical protein FH972_023576 [Carpinus fangiana]|uniref:serine--tRNA ligase n=1 Tax=Carpinus fangiana TaxID=176857 RepID=A0A5N6KVZ0_9ROSI|nr:hypothetical protein FH972_023576 [Carpinus fangiana]